MTPTKFPIFPVRDVVPHSGRMVLLDRIVSAVEGKLIAEVALRADSMFVRNGRARAIVTLEYMAQAVGCYVGTVSKMKNHPVEIGYLIGIREMTLAVGHVEAGDVLEVEAVHVFGNDQLGSFKTATRRNGTTIAEATLTVYRGDLPEEAS